MAAHTFRRGTLVGAPARPAAGQIIRILGNKRRYVTRAVHQNTYQPIPIPIPVYLPIIPTAKPVPAAPYAQPAYSRPTKRHLTQRHKEILKYFPTAIGVDDFIARVEIGLCGYGFTGDNSIAMTNLCRDEVTTVLKDKIEAAFGSSFNTNGLGAILTCGVTGVQAGLSHSPVAMEDGRERYVFFTFPHIAIDASGDVGGIHRPGRPGRSCACGALNKALIELKAEGVAENCMVPGVHDPLDPEYTILKQRLARRARYEQLDVSGMNLAEFTSVAERTITDDLEYLIEKCVDPAKADYAVVAGVQVHNWSEEFGNGSLNLEFVAPSKVYVCVNGEKTYLDLLQIPQLTPRQISLLARHSMGQLAPAHTEAVEEDVSISCTTTAASTLSTVPMTYLSQRLGRGHHDTVEDMQELQLQDNDAAGEASTAQQYETWSAQQDESPYCEWPSWQTQIRAKTPKGLERDKAAPTMESLDNDSSGNNGFFAPTGNNGVSVPAHITRPSSPQQSPHPSFNSEGPGR